MVHHTGTGGDAPAKVAAASTHNVQNPPRFSRGVMRPKGLPARRRKGAQELWEQLETMAQHVLRIVRQTTPPIFAGRTPVVGPVRTAQGNHTQGERETQLVWQAVAGSGEPDRRILGDFGERPTGRHLPLRAAEAEGRVGFHNWWRPTGF